MRPEPGKSMHWGRALLLAVVAAAGLVTLVGSGGGLGFPTCEWGCNGGGTPAPFGYASVFPQRITLQVGGTVTYSIATSETGTLTYQWRRSSDGGRSFVDIAGATGPTYTLSGVNLSDDGAVFDADVRAGNGSLLGKGPSRLAVSSMPGLVFRDGEFAIGDWLVSTAAGTSPGPPAHSEEQAASGGNPGAFRKMSYQMGQGVGSVRVFHALTTATYDPATQGAIHVIDTTEDCIVPSNPQAMALIESSPVIEQAGRRYIANDAAHCQSATWTASTPRASLGPSDFRLVDGPPCGVGESCPDLSAGGAPLRFGYMRHALVTVIPPTPVVDGIDNWTLTVWRR